MFFWYGYVAFEELIAGDIDRARVIYEKALETVPHKQFSFSKLWRLYAHFEIRRLNLDRARKILGNAIAKCHSESIFRTYIDMELQLGNIDRARKLYEKFIETDATNCHAWINYAKLEQSLEETDRCRAIFELAISQNVLDMPELIWKAYIDSEIEQENHGKVRELYDRLLTKTKHLKVWLSYAQFEVSVGQVDVARELFLKADQYFKLAEEKESRLLLLEAWLEMEQTHGTESQVADIRAKMPKKVKRQRRVRQYEEEEGQEGGWEEYLDYQFPDEEDQMKNSKLRKFAEAWKAGNASTV
jgi:crooked neck